MRPLVVCSAVRSLRNENRKFKTAISETAGTFAYEILTQVSLSFCGDPPITRLSEERVEEDVHEVECDSIVGLMGECG